MNHSTPCKFKGDMLLHACLQEVMYNFNVAIHSRIIVGSKHLLHSQSESNLWKQIIFKLFHYLTQFCVNHQA